MIKKILFVGDYDKDYNRTQIILTGLNAIGVEVIHLCFKRNKRNSNKKLIQELSKDVDFVFLPSFTHLDVKFVKKNIDKPLIFDPLISRYLTKVFDYKTVSKYSIRAYKNYLKDKTAFKYSDVIIADTQSHKEYFIETFKIPKQKIKVMHVGVDIHKFKPIKTNANKKFTVGFYGGFIPLQGVNKIISAAKLLNHDSSISFKLIGNGYEYEKIKKSIERENIDNIELIGWVDYDELPRAINKFDVCLGIFGESHKAEIVIPNKVFHYAACNKTIITKNTKGIKELFTNGENILLSSSEPKDIVDKILFAKNNKKESAKISDAAFKLITDKYNAISIANRLIEIYKNFKRQR